MHKVYAKKHMLNKNYVSLAITSEYLGAPASSYGHIFLVFHNNEKPELESLIIQFTSGLN